MTRREETVRVRAPATSANLGAGFDIFGLALKAPYDDYAFRKAREWQVTNVGEHKAAFDEERSVFAFVWNAMKENFGLTGSLNIEALKRIKTKAGMGSSASEAAATAFAVNRLFKLGLNRQELVHWAGFGEAFSAGHPHYDNVAPAVLGGITITHSTDPLTVVRLNPPDLSLLLVRNSKTKGSTREARAVLPDMIPRADHHHNAGKLTGLVVASYTRNPDLFIRSLDDRVVEPARSGAGILPYLLELREVAAKHGFGAVASGAGPTLLVVGRASQAGHSELEAAVKALYDKHEIQTDLLWTQPSVQGVHLISARR